MYDKLKTVGQMFVLKGEFDSFEIIKNGNINSTYKVRYTCEGNDIYYVFQRINTNVFHDPKGIMSNIEKITDHILARYPDERILLFYKTKEGSNYYIDGEDSFWRVMNFIDSVTFNYSEDPAIIRSTGKAFGHFQMLLADFDGQSLVETIKDFHYTKKRLDDLFCDVERDAAGRVGSVKKEIEELSSVRERSGFLSELAVRKEIPVRVTHNDTKCNNVLFDRETKEPITVIDLDTVMPGLMLYDFGDAVRFIASTAAEDEPDVSKVGFDLSKFRAFAEGFLEETKNVLTADEIEYLPLAVFSITIELAARFLDDYINGDKYFKIDYPEHNLVRTRSQLALAFDMLAKENEMKAIIKELVE